MSYNKKEAAKKNMYKKRNKNKKNYLQYNKKQNQKNDRMESLEVNPQARD